MALDAKVDVSVNTADAVAHLKALEESYAKLGQQIKEKISAGKTDTLELSRLTRAYKSLGNQVRQMRSEYVNVDKVMKNLSVASLGQLRDSVKVTQEKLSKSTVGSGEFKKYSYMLDKLQSAYKRASNEIGTSTHQIQNALSRLDHLSLDRIEQLIKRLQSKLTDGSVARGSQEWEMYVKALQRARQSVVDIKAAIDGTKVDLRGNLGRLNSLSGDELQATTKGLQERLNGTSFGTKEWEQLASQLRQVKEQYERFKTAVKEGQVDIEGNLKRLNKLSLTELEQTLSAVTRKLRSGEVAQGSAAWQQLAEQFRKVKGQLSAVKGELEQGKLDLGKVFGNLKGASVVELERAISQVNQRLRDGSVVRGSDEWRKLNSQLLSAKAELASVNKELTRGDTLFNKFADSLNRYQYVWMLGAGATAGLVAGYTKWESYLKKKDTAKAHVKSITGMGDKEIEWFAAEAEKLSSTMDDTGLRIKDDAASILEAFRSVGAAKPELLSCKEALEEVTVSAARLSAASAEDLNTCVDALTRSLNIYSESASAAAKYTNVLAAGSRYGASAVGETSKAVVRAGVAAASANVPIEQLVGAIETVAEKGLLGEKSGTALKTFFLKLLTGAREFNPAAVGMSKALENLANAHLSAGDMLKMFEQRAYNAAQILIDNRDKFDYYTKAVTGTNMAVEQAAINSDTLDVRLSQLGNSLNVVKEQLALELKPIIGKVLIMIQSSIKYLLPLIQTLKAHSTLIKMVAGAVGMYYGRLLLLYVAHGKVAQGVLKFGKSLVKARTYSGLLTRALWSLRGITMGVHKVIGALAAGFVSFGGGVKKAATAVAVFGKSLLSLKGLGIGAFLGGIALAVKKVSDAFAESQKYIVDYKELLTSVGDLKKSAQDEAIQKKTEYRKYLDVIEAPYSSKEDFDTAVKALTDEFGRVLYHYDDSAGHNVLENRGDLESQIDTLTDTLFGRNLDEKIAICRTALEEHTRDFTQRIDDQYSKIDEALDDLIPHDSKGFTSWWKDYRKKEYDRIYAGLSEQLRSKDPLITETRLHFAVRDSQAYKDLMALHDTENARGARLKYYQYQQLEERRMQSPMNRSFATSVGGAYGSSVLQPLLDELERLQTGKSGTIDPLQKALDAYLAARKKLPEGGPTKGKFYDLDSLDGPAVSDDEKKAAEEAARRKWQTMINKYTDWYERVHRDDKLQPYDGFRFNADYTKANEWLIKELRRIWSGDKDKLSDIQIESNEKAKERKGFNAQLLAVLNRLGNIDFNLFLKRLDGKFAYVDDELIEMYHQITTAVTAFPTLMSEELRRALDDIEPLIRKEEARRAAETENLRRDKALAAAEAAARRRAAAPKAEPGAGLEGNGIFEEAREREKREREESDLIRRQYALAVKEGNEEASRLLLDKIIRFQHSQDYEATRAVTTDFDTRHNVAYSAVGMTRAEAPEMLAADKRTVFIGDNNDVYNVGNDIQGVRPYGESYSVRPIVGGVNNDWLAPFDPVGATRDKYDQALADLDGFRSSLSNARSALDELTGGGDLTRHEVDGESVYFGNQLNPRSRDYVGGDNVEAFVSSATKGLNASIERFKKGVNDSAEAVEFYAKLLGLKPGTSRPGGASSSGGSSSGARAAGSGLARQAEYKHVAMPAPPTDEERITATSSAISAAYDFVRVTAIAKQKIDVELARTKLQGLPEDSEEAQQLRDSINEAGAEMDKLLIDYHKRDYRDFLRDFNKLLRDTYNADLESLKLERAQTAELRELTLDYGNTQNLAQLHDADEAFLDSFGEHFTELIEQHLEAVEKKPTTKSVQQQLDLTDEYVDQRRQLSEVKGDGSYSDADALSDKMIAERALYETNYDNLLKEQSKRHREQHAFLEDLRQKDFISSQFYDEKKKDMEWSHFDDFMRGAKVCYDSFNQVATASSEYRAALVAADVARVSKGYDDMIAAAGNSQRRTTLLERKKQKEVARVQNEANKRAMVMQIAQAVATIAMSALEAFRSQAGIPVVGPALASIAMASALAAGAIQVATIKKQQEAQAAGYALGGFTPRGRWDEEQGVVHSGEFVANRFAVSNPHIRPALDLIDAAQRSNRVGSLTAEDVTASLRTRVSPDVVRAVVSEGPRAAASSADRGEALLAAAAAFDRNSAAVDRLERQLDHGVTAVAAIDGDFGVYRQLKKYERLMAKTRN